MKTNTQVEEMVDAWTNLQRQFWDSCLPNQSNNGMKSNKSDWQEACKQPLEVTRDMLSETLKTQAMLTRDTMRFADPKFIESGTVDQFFDSIQEMVNSGIDSEEELLDNWFSLAKDCSQQMPSLFQWNAFSYSNPALDWSQNFSDMMKAWETVAEKTLEVQSEFISQQNPEGKISDKKTRATNTKPGTQNRHKTAA